ncbi:MAG: hypothetical protein BWK76_11970 [Desulfobulbaceae bacterium A2]|nr:MAG: hypothetical protein BWK76_11970 [Desulfobulbaceae bacterium A2]
MQELLSTPSVRLLWIVLLTGVSICGLVDCVGTEPVRVGFVAQLTGVQAELGVQERNGVQMAVEEINASGGIAGRSIDLVVRDDLGTPEGAQAADRELMQAGVVAIIGHATSGQTIAGLAVTNPARVVMLSPTASTPELNGRDDFFFRITYSLADRAQALALHIYQRRNLTRVAVIYDTDNTAYSRTYLEEFAGKYQSLGGSLAVQADFSSRAQPDFASLVARLHAADSDGLLIIASDVDTAMIAQQARLRGWLVPLFSTAWAQTEALVTNGGKAVEGLEIEIAYPLDAQTPVCLDFKTRYQDRFGWTPSFSAALGYEAAHVLAAALNKTAGKADGLAQALVSIKNFKGLIDTFSIDRYGDVVRPFHLGTIRDGKYVDLEALKPTQPGG